MAVKIHDKDGRIRDLPASKPLAGTSTERVRRSATGDVVHRLKDALDRSDADTRRYRSAKPGKAAA
jgi:hypothetical protein